MHLVILQERDTSLERRVPSITEYPLQHVFPRVVRRMCFAGEYDLHGPRLIRDQCAQAFDITEEQIRSLVRGEASRKSDGERAVAEQRAGSHQLWRLGPMVPPPASGSLVDEIDQQTLETGVRAPKVAVVDLEHAVPKSGIVEPGLPLPTKVLVEQFLYAVGHPARQVDAVRHGADWYLGIS